MDAQICIVNYNLGNLRSIQNKFVKMGVNSFISSNINEIKKADKIVLPGVGHFSTGMRNLKDLGLTDVLKTMVLENKIPILGICLGTQLFAHYSEEGDCEGLGWIDAEVVKFKVSDKVKYKVPHMGWNNVTIKNSNSMDEQITSDDQFYFVHSYHLICKSPEDVWMKTEYDYDFVSAVHRNNIYGTQFHPEKSHNCGYELLKKFAEL